MQIWVLGTLEVSHDGRPVVLRDPLRRRLLALLSVSPGREVSTDRLVDGLWATAPPADAADRLPLVVGRLREELPEPDLVRAGRSGYLLAVSPCDVDALVLDREVAVGGKALVEGRLDEASSVLSEALRLWRGPPYAEFAGCAQLAVEAQRLAALRLIGLERRIAADLGRPGAPAPVVELEALVRWYPTHQPFWALLMAALYRCGRRADALACFQRARGALADRLGVEPDTALREVERLVTDHDPSLEAPGMTTFLS